MLELIVVVATKDETFRTGANCLPLGGLLFEAVMLLSGSEGIILLVVLVILDNIMVQRKKLVYHLQKSSSSSTLSKSLDT